jgi:hypothetical protein
MCYFVATQLKNDVQNTVNARSHVTDDTFKDLVLHRLGNDLLNSIDVTSFDVANLLYSRIIEEVMIGLDSALTTLVCAVCLTNLIAATPSL